jgi:hypothetical protein
MVNLGCVCVFFLNEQGTIYTTHGICRRICAQGTGSDYTPVIAMYKLGVITKEELAAHGVPAAMREKTIDIAEAAVASLDALERGGVKLTARQKARRAMLLDLTRSAFDEGRIPHWLRNKVKHALRLEAQQK